MLRIALQHWALIALSTIAGRRLLSASSLAQSNDLRRLFLVRPWWASLFVVLHVDLHSIGHTLASPYPVGRQGAPLSKEEQGGGANQRINFGSDPMLRFSSGEGSKK